MTSTPEYPSKDSRSKPCSRIALWVFSLVLAFFYAGAFFGWGSMQLLLEKNGAFSGVCRMSSHGVSAGTNSDGMVTEMETTSVCADQAQLLLNVQLLAQTTPILSPFLGYIPDVYGPVALMDLICLVGVACTMCLGLAVSLSSGDVWLFPAFVGLGVVYSSISINSVAVGMRFDEADSSKVISSLNAFFDAGAITFLGMWWIVNDISHGEGYDVYHENFSRAVWCYHVMAIVCMGVASYLWRKECSGDCNDDEEKNDEVDDDNTVDQAEQYPLLDDVDTKLSERASLIRCATGKRKYGSWSRQEKRVKALQHTVNKQESSLDINDMPAKDSLSLSISLRAPHAQLRSDLFLYVLLFYAVYVSKTNFCMATAREFLGYLGDDATGNKYLAWFLLLTPTSILGLPLLDFVITHYGFHGAFQVVNVLSLVHGVVMAIPNLQIQIVGFVVFGFYRCFLFGVVFSFLPYFLGPNAVGRASGITGLVAGICGFVNIGLSNAALVVFEGNYFVPNAIFTILGALVCIPAAFTIDKLIQRERPRL